MNIFEFIQRIFPKGLVNVTRCIYYGIPKYRLLQFRRIKDIKKKHHVNVVFLISTLQMWRYQEVYDKLSLDNRFSAYIVFCPFASYLKSEREKLFRTIKSHFEEHNVNLLDASNLKDAEQLLEQLDPDIIFYPQHYNNLFLNCWDYQNNKGRLISYIPYGLYTLYVDWAYQTEFTAVGWRMYYASEIHRRNAKNLSFNFGRNVRVVGEPHSDLYRTKVNIDPWPNNEKKRVIYAPHFQISPNDMFYRPSFIWTHELMLELAKKYSDKIHFAFKPHPRLFTALCEHPDWGEKRAAAYYEEWRRMPNTQFENGEFIDLFNTSNALIHDCGSFTAEYQYTKKPCLFLTKDERNVRNVLCEFGNKCLDNHYIGSSEQDILNFIQNVVLNGVDPKKRERERFYDEYLLPHNNKTTAENVYDDLVTSLFGK